MVFCGEAYAGRYKDDVSKCAGLQVFTDSVGYVDMMIEMGAVHLNGRFPPARLATEPPFVCRYMSNYLIYKTSKMNTSNLAFLALCDFFDSMIYCYL